MIPARSPGRAIRRPEPSSLGVRTIRFKSGRMISVACARHSSRGCCWNWPIAAAARLGFVTRPKTRGSSQASCRGKAERSRPRPTAPKDREQLGAPQGLAARDTPLGQVPDRAHLSLRPCCCRHVLASRPEPGSKSNRPQNAAGELPPDSRHTRLQVTGTASMITPKNFRGPAATRCKDLWSG